MSGERTALQHNVAVKAPGTFEAQEDGCLCPRMDNGWEIGNRYWGVDDDQARWIVVGGCPLHDISETVEGPDDEDFVAREALGRIHPPGNRAP